MAITPETERLAREISAAARAMGLWACVKDVAAAARRHVLVKADARTRTVRVSDHRDTRGTSDFLVRETQTAHAAVAWLAREFDRPAPEGWDAAACAERKATAFRARAAIAAVLRGHIAGRAAEERARAAQTVASCGDDKVRLRRLALGANATAALARERLIEMGVDMTQQRGPAKSGSVARPAWPPRIDRAAPR